jgi:cobalt-zinc-cadmium efflux system membrane fusion protein
MLKIRFLVVFAIMAVVLSVAAAMSLRHSDESVPVSEAAVSATQQDVHAGEKTQADAHSLEGQTGTPEQGHEVIVRLKDTAIKDFGIETALAQGGTIGMHTTLPAEITLNADAVAHIVPGVGGVVRSVSKNLGDKVMAGETLAVIHSRELSDYKAGYLGAKEKLTLAQAMFDREKNLWEKKITAEQEYLNAKRELADARIEMRSASQKLHALGFAQAYLEDLPNQPDESFIVYKVVTPIAGTIIEKHITLGEVLKEDSEPFVVADLSNVWVKVNVHQKDLPTVRRSQKAVIRTEHNQGEGVVGYVSGVLEENTRTALARIVLPNEDGMWRPGTFATASIYLDQADCKIVVAKEALVTMEGNPFVFIVKEDGFAPQEVRLGRVNGEFAEVVSGLEPGQKYVAKGASTLKSEIVKSNEDPCGGH